MKLIEYADRDMLTMDLANVLAGALKNALLSHAQVGFAVPGGTTPGPIFDVLCAADLDWSRVHVTLTDERWVGEDSPRSNAALLRSRLLVGRASDAVFHPLYIPGVTPATGAAEAAGVLAPCLPLSVLLLGMGADMHTASLFPGAPELVAALAPDAPAVVPIHQAGQEPRVSLSGPILSGAMSKHAVIFGAEKRAAFEAAQSMAAADAPILSAGRDLHVHWAE